MFTFPLNFFWLIACGMLPNIQQVPEGNGSGVVWDGQGHIVTNYHGRILKNYMIIIII